MKKLNLATMLISIINVSFVLFLFGGLSSSVVAAAGTEAGVIFDLVALSNYAYRRLALADQSQQISNACNLLLKNSPDSQIVDCSDEQLFGTSLLVEAGLILANSTNTTQQQQGYDLLDELASVVFSGTPMLPLSDVWGYDDPITGRSYGLIGASNGVHILDITVSIQPVNIFFLQGAYTIWRDIKIFNSTLYAVNDNNWGSFLEDFPNVNQSYIDPWRQMDGLVIIDLSYALQPHFVSKDNRFFYTAHNIQVEHSYTNTTCSWCRSYAYVVGQQEPGWTRSDVRNYGGFQILDISNNLVPTLAGAWNTTYIHDIVIQYRDGSYIGFACAIYALAGVQPGLFIINVTDPHNPTTLAAYNMLYNYTHNSWPTDDGKYLYVTHETLHAPISIWDISDLSDVTHAADLFLIPGNEDIVAHNVHVRGNRLWVSYYSMGSTVYDITDPLNPVLIGWYDTAPDYQNGMDGTWGIYPYSKNKLALSTDMSNGFYVLNLTQTYALQGPEGPEGPGSETLKVFIIVSSIVHGVSILAIIILIIRSCSSNEYSNIK